MSVNWTEAEIIHQHIRTVHHAPIYDPIININAHAWFLSKQTLETADKIHQLHDF